MRSMRIVPGLAARASSLLLLLGGCGPPLAAPGPDDAVGATEEAAGAEQAFGDAVRGLCRMAVGQPTDWPLAPPPPGYRNRGTPNHKLLWRVWYYGWALRGGSAAQRDDARDFLLAHFSGQQSEGHGSLGGANEVLTTSHYQLWAQGVAGARLLASVAGDGPVLGATGRWWRAEKALYDVLARDGSIDAPGARFKEGQAGPSGLRDVVYAQLRGRPLPGRAANPRAPWWDDKYNAAAWMIRELQRRGDDMGGAGAAGPADLPRLRDTLHVYSRGDDYVFSFPVMHGALQPLFWTARIGGERSYAPYVSGSPTTSAVPAPPLPGARHSVVQGFDEPLARR